MAIQKVKRQCSPFNWIASVVITGTGVPDNSSLAMTVGMKCVIIYYCRAFAPIVTPAPGRSGAIKIIAIPTTPLSHK